MNYTNPRMSFETNDWPYGRQIRVRAVFAIEQGKKGERTVRITDNPKGGQNKPKKTTFSLKARIVDGDDGKTYIAELSQYGNITIMQSNMQYQEESVFPGDDKYPELLNLFN